MEKKLSKLFNIQQALKAPKSLKNDFAGFNYRSAEQILEALKPLLKKEGCTLILGDELVNFGDRYYVKSIAILADEDKEICRTEALAREQETKKGMDEAQITGAASSYARKYALCGLFAIDAGNDPDSHDNTGQGQSKASDVPTASSNKLASPAQKNFILKLYTDAGQDPALISDFIQGEGLDPATMTSADASRIIKQLQGEA